ncbi:hypothetical protein T492DRAFT_872539 [Pavlovales sp. CCMP2436]|nr:hypothetical protein T492DRAFT_872539 [Pavlovales sp. CCMP2436]
MPRARLSSANRTELAVLFAAEDELGRLCAAVATALAELGCSFSFVAQPFDEAPGCGGDRGDLLVVRLHPPRSPDGGGLAVVARRAAALLRVLPAVSAVAPQRLHSLADAQRAPLAREWTPPQPPDGPRAQVVDALGARALWARGVRGAGVHVAIFDTGLSAGQPCLSHVVAETDWTGDGMLTDNVGHGTFMAGAIASTCDCLGLAPDVRLHVYRVFNSDAESQTSWLVKALGHAIRARVDVINLSMGGPDFRDVLFTRKIDEAVGSGIVIASGIGNSGPLWGTSLNPGDQPAVIGVGSVNRDGDGVARWSSRGATKTELPDGPGRAKPDVLTVGEFWAAKQGGGCQFQWGTSVSCPVVSAALALILSGLEGPQRARLNPGALHQLLLESARPLGGTSVFESGAGVLDLGRALEAARSYAPHASTFPASLDLCAPVCARAPGDGGGASRDAAAQPPSLWPLCTQPLHAGGAAVAFNLTIVSGLSAFGRRAAARARRPAAWHPANASHARLLAFEVEAPVRRLLWPYGGGLGVRVRATRAAAAHNGCVEGELRFAVVVTGARGDPLPPGGSSARSEVRVHVRVRVQPPPTRAKRLLLDLGHSLHYPRVDAPSDDNLLGSGGGYDAYDWLGDSPLTNFAGLFAELGARGYDVDTTSDPLTDFDAAQYGALLLIDPEDFFTAQEVAKLRRDVLRRGLGLVVLADWHDIALQRTLRAPVGGANVPALNALLSPLGLALGGVARSGTVRVPGGGAARGAHTDAQIAFASGSCVAQARAGARLLSARLRRDTALLGISKATAAATARKAAAGAVAGPRAKPPPALAAPGGQMQAGAAVPLEEVVVLVLAEAADEMLAHSVKLGGDEAAAELAAGGGALRRGRVAVYADSGCADDDRAAGEACWGLVEQLVAYATTGALSESLRAASREVGASGFSGADSGCARVPSENPQGALLDAQAAARRGSSGRVPGTDLPPLAPFSRTAGALRACALGVGASNCSFAREMLWAPVATVGLSPTDLAAEAGDGGAGARGARSRGTARGSRPSAAPEGQRALSRLREALRPDTGAVTNTQTPPAASSEGGGADARTGPTIGLSRLAELAHPTSLELLLMPALALLGLVAVLAWRSFCRPCTRGWHRVTTRGNYDAAAGTQRLATRALRNSGLGRRHTGGSRQLELAVARQAREADDVSKYAPSELEAEDALAAKRALGGFVEEGARSYRRTRRARRAHRRPCAGKEATECSKAVVADIVDDDDPDEWAEGAYHLRRETRFGIGA